MAGTSFYFQLLLGIALLSTLNCCSQATNAFQAAQQLNTSVIVEAAAAVTQQVQGGALESTQPLHFVKQHWQTTQQQHISTNTAEATAASDAAAVQRVLLQEARTSIQLRPIPEDPVPQAASKGQQQHTAPSETASNTASWKAQQQQQHQLQQQQQQQQAQPAQPVISKGFLNHDSHKSLLPIDYKDVILFILSFLVLSLAAGAGIGKRGGGVFCVCVCGGGGVRSPGGGGGGASLRWWWGWGGGRYSWERGEPERGLVERSCCVCAYEETHSGANMQPLHLELHMHVLRRVAAAGGLRHALSRLTAESVKRSRCRALLQFVEGLPSPI